MYAHTTFGKADKRKKEKERAALGWSCIVVENISRGEASYLLRNATAAMIHGTSKKRTCANVHPK
jgi:hypothetical protein